MAENSKWYDHVFNPWRRVGTELSRTSDRNWRNLRKLGHDARVDEVSAQFILKHKKDDEQKLAWALAYRRPRVLCGSLCDVFDSAVPNGWRIDLFNLICQTPNLDWIIPTKHIGNANGMLPKDRRGDPMSWGCGWFNVWLGAIVCNQEEADRDIPKLLTTPAVMRFLSMEPLLGQVDISRWLDDGSNEMALAATLNWAIVGGESGPHARPMHPDWVRSLRDQCQSAGVPLFFKQWGTWAPAEAISDEVNRKLAAVWIRKDGSIIDGDEIDFFGDDAVLYRAGKKDSGRLLDGLIWGQVPAC